jgi:DNA repair protein RecN (Recombination protein N)
MLQELYIKNYALIRELTVSFSENLTVLSGETGAGKSIIIGALGLILGEKAKTSLIRSGASSCTVEGRFRIEKGHQVYLILSEKGIEFGDGEDLVIRRTITDSGISKSYINGLQVAVKDLKDVTSILIDIHGQHEHQSLLNVKNQLFLLDQYGKHTDLLDRYRDSYERVENINAQIERQTMDKRERERRIDILSHSITEIETADLSEGEDQQLEEEYIVLKNYEKLVSSINSAYTLLSEDDRSAITTVDEALGELEKIKDLSGELGALVQELEGMREVVSAVASSLRGYLDGIDYEPGKIDAIQSRIELIKSLKKKYGDSIEEIKEYKERCAEELCGLEQYEDTIRDLKKRLEEELGRAGSLAKELSVQRRVAAQTLKESVMQELSYLSMDKAGFKVMITYREKADGWVEIDGRRYELTKNGLDFVVFLLSANRGEPFLPLKDVASGGELSRIMLAIKTVLGGADPILTFVFDEVDAGIGGKVSWAVGKRLKELSRNKQILCITHQAQIASKGDRNIRVDKVERDKRSVTEVRLLEDSEKVAEIARMISGARISEAAMRQAHQMINE